MNPIIVIILNKNYKGINIQRVTSGNIGIELTFLMGIKKIFFVLAMVLMCFIEVANATDFVVDKGFSTVKWKAKKGTGIHHGTIEIASGTISADEANITGGTVIIDMTTIVDVDLTDSGYNQKLI